MVQPLEITNDLIINELNKLSLSGVINELTLKKIEIKAKNLMNVNAASSHQVLGMLCSLRNDKNGVHEHFEIALNICNYDDKYQIFSNYAVSLRKLGFYDEALDQTRRAYRIKKEHGIIFSLIDLNTNCGRFEEALSYISELEKLNVPLKQNLPTKDKIEKFSLFMKDHALRDSDLVNFTSIAEKIALEHNLIVSSFFSKIYKEDSNEWISIEAKVDESPEYVASLNIILAEKIIDAELPDILLEKVSCRFIPYIESNKNIKARL